MISNTLTNRVYLIVINITLIYLFAWLGAIGLVSITKDKKTHMFSNSTWNSVYTFCSGILMTGMYFWHVYSLFSDPNLGYLYSGVGNITAIILEICSVVLVTAFYGLGFRNRTVLGTKFMQLKHIDSEEELHYVYLRVFNKVILVNSACLTCIIGMAFRAQMVSGINGVHLAGFHIIPYLVKSLTSSMVYLGTSRTSFLFYKMNLRLLEIRKDLKRTTSLEETKRPSQFEKMSKFCKVSEQIDELSVCFEKVNGTALQMTDMYKYHIVLVLSYSIIVTIHELFIQYQAVSRAMRGEHPLDLLLVLFSVVYIVLNIVEIFLVVNIIDSCHSGSLRIGKTLQSLLYFENIDVRLKQSVETFSLQVAHTKLQVTLCGMHLLDFPLILSIVDSTLTYLVIMVQFDLK